MKRRISAGSRPHKPRAVLSLEVGTAVQTSTRPATTAEPFVRGEVNRSGLNGLSTCGIAGLSTVRMLGPIVELLRAIHLSQYYRCS